MKKFYMLLLLTVIVVKLVSGTNSVVGTIKDNRTWLLNTLSVRPAMTASLEYHVQYPYVEGRARPIITFYYNGQKSPNLVSHCETDMYGQLRNEDLGVPLNEPYRGKFFCYKNETNKIYHCRGKTKIQDFEPKSYSFSFCNECGSTNGNLNGLWYNVTIYDESNKTNCVDLNMAQGQRIDRCERSYRFAAIPNQIGATDLATMRWQVDQAQRIMDQIIDLVAHKSCLQEFYQVLCLVALPECLPEENEIVLPCREYCDSLLNNCLEKEPIVVLVEEFALNCKYLPSQKDNNHCFMQVDVCGPPLEINHGYILEGNIPFTREGHVVQYACNDSWVLTGSPNSTCQQGGAWTTIPECVEPTKPLSLVLIICLGVGGFIALVLTVTAVSVYCRRRKRERGESEPSIIDRRNDPLVPYEPLYE